MHWISLNYSFHTQSSPNHARFFPTTQKEPKKFEIKTFESRKYFETISKCYVVKEICNKMSWQNQRPPAYNQAYAVSPKRQNISIYNAFNTNRKILNTTQYDCNY